MIYRLLLHDYFQHEIPDVAGKEIHFRTLEIYMRNIGVSQFKLHVLIGENEETPFFHSLDIDENGDIEYKRKIPTTKVLKIAVKPPQAETPEMDMQLIYEIL